MNPPLLAKSFVNRLLPRNTFWRFMLGAVFLTAVTLTAALIISSWLGYDVVSKMQRDNSLVVLRNTVDLVGRFQINREELYSSYMQERKEGLKNLNRFGARFLDSYTRRIDRREISEEDALELAFEQLNFIIRANTIPLFLIDENNTIVVHPQENVLHKNIQTISNPDRDPHLSAGEIFPILVRKARRSDGNETVFAAYKQLNTQTAEEETRIAAATYYAPWNLVICSDLSTDDITRELAEKTLTLMNELRARIQEIILGESGYVYIVDQNCGMIAHPVLTGANLKDFLIPGTDINICAEVIRTAELPWGENKLEYDWNRPDDRANYIYPKISWSVREPTTGWYVASSIYTSEIAVESAQFKKGIFYPALGSVILIVVLLAFLLHKLLQPVQKLTAVCQDVSGGDYQSRAPDNAPGDMGFLCRQFNIMLANIVELRAKEEFRRNELEELNKNLETIVAIRTRALQRKAYKLEETNVRLRELDRMKSALLSSVSHELRTPLTSIVGFAKLISKDIQRFFLGQTSLELGILSKAERIDRNLVIITKEGERLTRLINDLLDLAKIESGQMQWRDSYVSLNEVMDRSIDSLSSTLAMNPDISLECELKGEIPPLFMDRDRLTQLCLNLINNAAKFTKSGEISICGGAHEGWVQFSVKDSGIGIPTDNLIKIFDKFHQVTESDTIVDKPQGTGLGLAICHNIVTHYGGLIWAESSFGRGASFYVELPIDWTRHSSDDHLRGPTSEFSDAGSHSNDHKPSENAKLPTVLVLDKTPEHRARFIQALRTEGYMVESAPNMISALEEGEPPECNLILASGVRSYADITQLSALMENDQDLRELPVIAIFASVSQHLFEHVDEWTQYISEIKLIRTINSLLRVEAARGPNCLLIRPESAYSPDDAAAALIAKANIISPDELLRYVEDGFVGPVLVPHNMLQSIELQHFMNEAGIFLVILPNMSYD